MDHRETLNISLNCKAYMEQARNSGWLGLKLEPSESDGAMVVSEVVTGSPAENAGFRSGDVLLAVNGVTYSDENQDKLKAMQKSLKPGVTASYNVQRNGKQQTLTATLGELPTRDGAGGLRRQGEETRGEDTLDGVTVDDLSARTRSQFDIPNNIRGTIVAEVDPESPAYRAGLLPGHVILEIDRKPVRSMFRSERRERHWIVVATAHPAKFDTIVEPLVGEPVPPPPDLARLLDLPASFTTIVPDIGELASRL